MLYNRRILEYLNVNIVRCAHTERLPQQSRNTFAPNRTPSHVRGAIPTRNTVDNKIIAIHLRTITFFFCSFFIVFFRFHTRMCKKKKSLTPQQGSHFKAHASLFPKENVIFIRCIRFVWPYGFKKINFFFFFQCRCFFYCFFAQFHIPVFFFFFYAFYYVYCAILIKQTKSGYHALTI